MAMFLSCQLASSGHIVLDPREFTVSLEQMVQLIASTRLDNTKGLAMVAYGLPLNVPLEPFASKVRLGVKLDSSGDEDELLMIQYGGLTFKSGQMNETS